MADDEAVSPVSAQLGEWVRSLPIAFCVCVFLFYFGYRQHLRRVGR